MPHVRAVDAEQPVVGPDPAVQRSDRVLEDLHDEDAGLGAAAADPDAEVLPRLKIMMIIMTVIMMMITWRSSVTLSISSLAPMLARAAPPVPGLPYFSIRSLYTPRRSTEDILRRAAHTWDYYYYHYTRKCIEDPL